MYSWEKKISDIVLDFDPSTSPWQVKYCCLRNLQPRANAPNDKCRN